MELKENEFTVLWTGGLDSTYRFCQLARMEGVVIHPVYIIDREREPCIDDEFRAQFRLYNYIVNHPKTKAEILPTDYVYRESIPSNNIINRFYPALEQYGLGWQFLFIALYAQEHPGCELCQEKLWSCLPVEKVKFYTVNNHQFMDTSQLDDVFKVFFSKVSFPIINVSRKSMIKKLKKWDYDGILNFIWFCYQGIDGKPCGFCDNCRKKITEGLKFLFTEEGIHRYLMFLYVNYFHNYASNEYFKEYCFSHGDLSCSPEYRRYNGKGKKTYAKDCFSYFRKLDKLSNEKLKRLIITGSVEYGCRSKLLPELLSYANDIEREKKWMDIFKKAGI